MLKMQWAFARNGMTSAPNSNPSISHIGLVHGWPDSTASMLFDRAKRNFGEHAAAIALPEAACADIDQALRELVRIVLALFPAWLPEAKGIDTPAGAGDSAVADVARAAAERSSLFGPLLVRLARAALANQTSPALDGIPREVVALECGKLIRATYQLGDIILILPATTLDGTEIQACERTVLWLADHVKCAVWIAGPTAARMPRIRIIRDAIAPLAHSDEHEPAGTVPTPPPWVTPLAGRPNPFSTAEQRLEVHLAAQDWADGRAWNQGWQAGAKHNRIVVDLVWKREQLVVEIDGPDHLGAEKFAADRHRDRLLQLQGFAVLRFTNEEVLNDPAQVASQIERFLKQKRTMKKS
jgi:very-short-patch-repair endonuclease